MADLPTEVKTPVSKDFILLFAGITEHKMEASSATVTAMAGHAMLTCAAGGLVLELVKSQLHLLVKSIFLIRSHIVFNLDSTNQSRIKPFKFFLNVLIAENII